MLRRLHVVAFALSVALAVAPAFPAGSDTNGLIRSLQKSDDFRVRTQAALALGGCKSKEALLPLCDALGDENATVRAAAAAGIGRLHLGGESCLERQRKSEKNSTVQSALKKAIAQLRAEPEPEFTRRTQYYVAVGKITDSTGRSGTEVVDLVRKAMRDAADSSGTIVLAPSSETTAEATKRLAAHKGVKGLYLMPRVGAPQYSDKGVKLKVEVAYLTYPGKALLGMMGIPLSATGVRGKDRDIEDQLITAAAERAIEKVTSFGADLP
jgi:hypothetical protein